MTHLLLISLLFALGASDALTPGQPELGLADAQRAIAAPPKDKAPAKDKAPTDEKQKKKDGFSCTLTGSEAPRGGRIEVKGEGFGRSPIVRIGGKVARLLERGKHSISVQVARDSNGGAVTVQSGRKKAQCGVLTIIGKN